MGSRKREVMYNPSVVSYSALSDFLRCPKYFEYIYILKQERGINSALTRGLKIHKLCEKLCKIEDPNEVMDLMKGWDKNEIDRGIRYAEYFIDKHIPTIRNSEGKSFEGIEFYDLLKLERGIKFEYHIDNIHYCKDGTLRVMDVKTGLVVPNREQIENDMQLQAYTWALLETLNMGGQVVPPRIQIGIWFWTHGYNIFAEYTFPDDMKEKIIKVAKEIKRAKKEKYFPRTANTFCAGCPMFEVCFPNDIAKSYKECKELAEHWAEKAKKKKMILLNKMETIGTTLLKDKDNNLAYFIKTKNFTKADIDDLIKKTGGDIEKLKPFISPSKTDLKKYGLEEVKQIPTRTQVELHYKNIL